MYIFIVFLILVAFPAHGEKAVRAPWVGEDLKGLQCTGSQGYGPFDYSKRGEIDPIHLKLVEGAHFKPDVENLLEGEHRSGFGSAWPDLDYTLRAWPNHPRALLSIIRFQLKINRKLTKVTIPIPAECYLNRAIHFSPEDPAPYALYGYYMHKLGHLDKADTFYKKATELAPENAKFAYSYSFLLIDMKRYDEALTFAKIAYSHRRTPQALKNKLEKLGVWK